MFIHTDHEPWVQSACVKHLIKRAELALERTRLPATDARSYVFQNVISYAQGGLGVLNLLYAWSADESVCADVKVNRTLLTVPHALIIPGLLGMKSPVDQEAVNEVAASIERLARNGMAMKAQAQIENGLRNLARALRLKPQDGFAALAKAVIRKCGLPPTRFHVLRVPAEIRNSFHDNGIFRHRNGTFTTDIDGVEYRFDVGHRVRCASWGHIAHALEGALVIFEELCLSETVMLIGSIKDEYAEQKRRSL